jgi:hypothetical protein
MKSKEQARMVKFVVIIFLFGVWNEVEGEFLNSLLTFIINIRMMSQIGGE